MDQETIDVYNRSAADLAAKFDELGVRTSDIKEAFDVCGKENPKVVEIGCGNGRDAEEILRHTDDYLGIDASEGMIALAKAKVPAGKFKVADVENFVFPKKMDIVFAFASLLHVSKESFKNILAKILADLNNGGVVRISLKYRDKYEKNLKEDDFGTRLFYFYSKDDMEELARGFTIIKSELVRKKDTTWLEVLLQK